MISCASAAESSLEILFGIRSRNSYMVNTSSPKCATASGDELPQPVATNTQNAAIKMCAALMVYFAIE